MADNNRTDKITGDQKLIEGLTSRKASLPALYSRGKLLTPDDAIHALQGRIDASKGVVAAHAALQAAIAGERAVREQTDPLAADVEQVVRAMYGDDPAAMNEFGLEPRKERVLSPEAKVIAAAKARATREARGTKGKKQLAAIKGVPPATVTIAVTGGKPHENG
jgi:hypothetical protein